MTDQSKGGVDMGAPMSQREPSAIALAHRLSAAMIVVRGMVAWGVLSEDDDAGQRAEEIVNVRSGMTECNGFQLAMGLYFGPWKGIKLNARSVDMLERMDDITQEMQAAHDRYFLQTSEAWLGSAMAGASNRLDSQTQGRA